MESIDTVSITILLGAVLVLAGIMSSLVALRFGAPLLLVFLLVGMLAGESGPGGIKFDDVRLAYTVGSVALGADPVRRRPAHPVRDLPQRAGAGGHAGDRRRAGHRGADRAGRGLGARAELDRGAAGRRGGGLDRRRGGVLPDACQGPAAAAARRRDARGRIRHQRSVRDLPHHRAGRDPAARPQSLDRDRHVPGPRGGAGRHHRLARRPRHGAGAQPAGTAAGPARAVRRDRRAGDVRPGRVRCTARASSPSISPAWSSATARPARTTPSSTFLDAATWLAQIAMFVLLGLLAWPDRLPQRAAAGAGGGAGADADRAARRRCFCASRRSASACARSCSSPGSACAARSRCSSPRSRCWSGLPGAHFYFDVAFVVVLVSLAIQGWTIARCGAAAAHRACRAPTSSRAPHRARSARARCKQELVGYPVVAGSPYLRRGITPSWAKLTLVVRDEQRAYAGGSARRARRRSRLFPGAAGTRAGARPLLCRAAAAGVARCRVCSRISSCRATPRSARWPRSTAWTIPPARRADAAGRFFRASISSSTRRGRTTPSRSGR